MKENYTFLEAVNKSQDKTGNYKEAFKIYVQSALLLCLAEENILTKEQYGRCLKLLKNSNEALD